MKKCIALLLCLVLCLNTLAFAEESWVCPNCGEENGADDAFCENCGVKRVMGWDCPVCGRKNNLKNFCGGCGTAKPEEEAKAPAEEPEQIVSGAAEEAPAEEPEQIVSDAAEEAPAKKPVVDCRVGDILVLGNWNGEPIRWQVVEAKEDGSYVLLCVNGLEVKKYNDYLKKRNWGNCSLRNWLNGDFYENAFSAEEKEMIVLSTLENVGNKNWGIPGSEPTEDHVYILSQEEVGRYFNIDPLNSARCKELICKPTEKAVADNARINKAGNCRWWLRNPGGAMSEALFVDGAGTVVRTGTSVNKADICVRPVICVKF